MKKNILLIDDDSDEPEIFSTALKDANVEHKCTWAQSVEHALCIMEHLLPDVIFIDFNMPGVNGIDGIRMIRANDNLTDIPVVLYSTCISEQNRSIALVIGATACIQKHIVLAQLSDALTRFFKADFIINDSNITEQKWEDKPIEELALSEGFKKAAVGHGLTHLRQFLEMPQLALQETTWITTKMLDELEVLVKNNITGPGTK